MDEALLHDSFLAMSPGGVALEPHEVHVWAVPLAGDGEAYLPLLSPAERTKAERFRFVDHRRRHVISHGAMRMILAGYLAADPAALAYTVGARGKPAVARGDVHFNLSHSAQMAMVAVAATDVGIDVEKLRHLERLIDIARRQFSAVECEALEALPTTDQLTAFYRCWTRKESYVKALGLGLSALDVFDVAIGERAALLALRDGGDLGRWALQDVSPGPDYVAALAVGEPRPCVRTFRFGDR